MCSVWRSGRLGVPASTSCCSSIVWGGWYISVGNIELSLPLSALHGLVLLWSAKMY